MDPIELMSIKPSQIKQALGEDRVKLIRGSRHVYNVRQGQIRRGHEAESDDDDQELELETTLIWRCTDVACGGVLKRRIGVPKAIQDNWSQTDRMDMAHYWDTKEELKLHNVTVLTGKARNIQRRAKRLQENDSYISIEHSGSISSIGSQVNLDGQKKQSKATKYFLRMKKVLKDLFVEEALPANDDTSTDDEIPEHEPEERDHEWLEHTESEQSQDDMQTDFEQRMKDMPPRRRRTELQCHNLMSALKPFFWFMRLGGRWPLETYIEDRLVKFRLRKFSLNFVIFVFTSLYLLLGTFMGTVKIIDLVGQPANGTSQTYESQREHVLFDKYWPYVFITILLAAYTTVWNLATIFDDGRFTADFMSRWNLGVVAINCNPCEGFKCELWISFGWLTFYLATIMIFYIWDLIPAVRGTSELLGILLLSPWMSKTRIAEYYISVRSFGFFFHLYAVYSARAVTLLVIVYCKFLENLARRWNLRFCYVCGMLGRFELPHKFITYHTVIPYTKLFSEHKLILAFSRHTSLVFSVALTAYFMEKFLEILLLSYRTCCLFMFEDDDSYDINGTLKTLPCPPGYPYHCHTIKFRDEDVYLFMSLFYYTGQSIFGWYITSESISNCGQAIMSGFNFVRRYGFPRCKNSKERRFIQSLTFVFAPISNYCVSPGYLVINRTFIYEMFALLFVFTSMLVSFSPFQLANTQLTLCFPPNSTGPIPCHTLLVAKFQRFRVIKEYEERYPGVRIYLGGRPIFEEVEPPATATEAPDIPATTEEPSIPKYVRCPRRNDRVPGPGVPSTVTYPNMIAVPHGCVSAPPTSSWHNAYPAARCFRNSMTSHQILTQPYESAPPRMYYCGTETIVNLSLGRDDCGNLPFSPDGLEPPKKAVRMLFRRARLVFAVTCCCYDYDFYRESELSIRVEDNACAMNHILQATKFCGERCSLEKTC